MYIYYLPKNLDGHTLLQGRTTLTQQLSFIDNGANPGVSSTTNMGSPNNLTLMCCNKGNIMLLSLHLVAVLY